MPKKADWNPWQTILATLPDLWHGKDRSSLPFANFVCQVSFGAGIAFQLPT